MLTEAPYNVLDQIKTPEDLRGLEQIKTPEDLRGKKVLFFSSEFPDKVIDNANKIFPLMDNPEIYPTKGSAIHFSIALDNFIDIEVDVYEDVYELFAHIPNEEYSLTTIYSAEDFKKEYEELVNWYGR